MKPIDERLANLKLSLATERLHEEAVKCWSRANAEVKKLGNFARLQPAFVEFHIEALRKYLDEIDRVYREVWASDGNALTPEFIRAILVPRLFTTIAVRAGCIRHELELYHAREVTLDLPRGHHIIAHEMNRLKTRIANRFEAEAIELSKRQLRERQAMKRVPPLLNPVWTGGIFHSTPEPEAPRPSAPKPPSEVGGRAAGDFRDAKASQVAANPPSYFPTELWPKTQVIMGEAVRKFPTQAQTLELCRYVISEMTPVFRSAVDGNKIKSGAVLVEGLGGMADLLHSLLVYNDSGLKSGFSSLSDQAYRLGQELRKSDEWLTLAREMDSPTPQDGGRRPEEQAWAKLERRGEFIVLADSSAHTATVIRHDYDLLTWNIRKLDQWASQVRDAGKQPTIEDAKAAFSGTIVVGSESCTPYLTDGELEQFINHSQTVSLFAEGIMAKRWGLRNSTVRTYIRRKSQPRNVGSAPTKNHLRST